jgi:hypothetical protein
MPKDKKLTSAKSGAESAAKPVAPALPKTPAQAVAPVAATPSGKAAASAASPSATAAVVKAKAPARPAVRASADKKVAGKKTSAVKQTAPVPARAPAPQAEGKAKAKAKLVRDSFTMPPGDYELIAQLKQRALKLQRATKKSELLRAGLQALTAMSDAQLLRTLEGLSPIKTGRPKASGKLD